MSLIVGFNVHLAVGCSGVTLSPDNNFLGTWSLSLFGLSLVASLEPIPVDPSEDETEIIIY